MARIIFGHRSPAGTEVYAELDHRLALEVLEDMVSLALRAKLHEVRVRKEFGSPIDTVHGPNRYWVATRSSIGSDVTALHFGPGTGVEPAILAALMVTSDHLPVVADYRVVPEPVLGVLLLISSLGLLRPRFLGLARHEVLNQLLPCSITALTGPGSGIILPLTGSGTVSGLQRTRETG